MEKTPNGGDDGMDFFYGEISEENQDDDGTDSVEGVKLELKKEVGVAGWWLGHVYLLSAQRIENIELDLASSLPCRAQTRCENSLALK